MASSSAVKEQYDLMAREFNASEEIPLFRLGTQLLQSALGDCAGLRILDLGGGTGVHARMAVDAGAAQLDVVDLSPGMLRVGEEEERSLNRAGRIRWFQGDTTKSLQHLGLGQYDLVMSSFMIDHASNLDELEAMWRNIVEHIKPGGRFVGARLGNPRAPGLVSGQYGETYKDHVDIPGGIQYTYTPHLAGKPIDFVATSLEMSYSGSAEMQHKVGLVDVEVEPWENAPLVREKPEFWEAFREDPCIVVMKARKPDSNAAAGL